VVTDNRRPQVRRRSGGLLRSQLPGHATRSRAAELESLQLAGVRAGSGELRDRVAVAGRVADDQRARGNRALDDVVPRCSAHRLQVVPASLVLNARFDRLTAWLDRLTTRDLVRGRCRGTAEHRRVAGHAGGPTDLRPVHSSGTTGTIVVPAPHRARRTALFARRGWVCCRCRHGRAGQRPLRAAVLATPAARPSFGPPSVRKQARSCASPNQLAAHVAGGEDGFHALHPGRMSSDVLFLAGRLRAAQARGSPAMPTYGPRCGSAVPSSSRARRGHGGRAAGLPRRSGGAASGRARP